jgi:hypothetical protein
LLLSLFTLLLLRFVSKRVLSRRTPVELQRRCDTIIRLVEKEFEDFQEEEKKKKKSHKKKSNK